MKFYICKHCGNIITFMENKGVPVMCCGEKMSELIPGSTDAATEKHVPVISVNGSNVTVTVGSVAHPMLEEHSIKWIVLETAEGFQRKDPETGRQTGSSFCADRGRQGSCRLRLLRPARPVERKRINDTIFQKNTSKQKRASEVGRPLFS